MNTKRVRLLKDGKATPGPVVYWMSRDQRVHDNWALLCAQTLALQARVPLCVVFCLIPEFLGATLRQYGFMIKGLQEVEYLLEKKNISFHLLTGSPTDRIVKFAQNHMIGTLITDFDPLKIKRKWKEDVAEKIDIPFYEVDAHNIVPCWRTSPLR